MAPDPDADWIDDYFGKRLKWKDGYRSIWQQLLIEFLPQLEAGKGESLYAECDDGCTESQLKAGGGPLARRSTRKGEVIPWSPSRTTNKEYQPQTEKEWLNAVDDSNPPDTIGFGVARYQFINDVFCWALDCTLKYCRFRMHWGRWSPSKRANFEDRADTFFLSRPRSERACKFLVHWFFRFAESRRLFHLLVGNKIRVPLYQQVKPNASAREIAAKRKSHRPPPIRMGKNANEDLWLILIWPVALHHGWTYQDVVRSLRLHFGYDHLHRPPPRIADSETIKMIEASFERPFWSPRWMSEKTATATELWFLELNPVPAYIPKPLADWQEQAFRVNAADGKAMRLRCLRLGLPKLTPRGRDVASKPPLFDLVAAFLAPLRFPPHFSCFRAIGLAFRRSYRGAEM